MSIEAAVQSAVEVVEAIPQAVQTGAEAAKVVEQVAQCAPDVEKAVEGLVLHCLKCKGKRPVKDVKITEAHFESKKKKKAMSRRSYLATCCSCGKTVRQFIKNLVQKSM